MTPVRLEPAAPQSRVKHSTTALPNRNMTRVQFSKARYHLGIVKIYLGQNWSVLAQLVGCYTGNQRVASLSLTAGGVTVLCP